MPSYEINMMCFSTSIIGFIKYSKCLFTKFILFVVIEVSGKRNP